MRGQNFTTVMLVAILVMLASMVRYSASTPAPLSSAEEETTNWLVYNRRGTQFKYPPT